MLFAFFDITELFRFIKKIVPKRVCPAFLAFTANSGCVSGRVFCTNTPDWNLIYEKCRNIKAE